MKKQSIITILLTVLMSMVGAKAFAYDIAVENADGVTIYYSYINDGRDLMVAQGPYTGNIIIPEEVTYMNRTRKVTSIRVQAFYHDSGITSVTIPNTVTSIGAGAFDGCSSLTTVNIPSSVTAIEDKTFYCCSSLTSIDIPNSVTTIGEWAFYCCSSLASINIPNSVTSIGAGAFDGSSSLTTVTISNSVTAIGYCTFLGCSSLTSINIPNKVRSIGYSAFEGCSSLTSITIPNSVKAIDHNAFDGCKGLTSVISLIKEPFGINGKSFSDRTFDLDVFNNVTLYVPAGTIEKYKSTYGWKDFLFIEEETGEESQCGDNVYYSYDNETHTLTISGQGAMDNYEEINNKITTPWYPYIEEIYNIIIEPGVTSIGSWAFFGCKNLTSLTIPNSVISIADRAFVGCERLPSVTIPNSVTSIGERAFYGCSSLTSLDIPNSVTSIGVRAFWDCENLTSLTIPNSVTFIGDGAFSFCGATSITIGNGITSIGSKVFYYCSNLLSVSIPNSVTSIGFNAFAECSNLTSLIIPNSVHSIGDGAFDRCLKLKNVYCYSESVPNTENTAFQRGPMESAILYVPASSIEAYRTTTPWSEFNSIVPIEGGDIPSTPGEEKTKKLTIHVAIPGTLPELISKEEKYQIEDLTLTGELNGTDFRLIRDMAGVHGYEGSGGVKYSSTDGNLSILDISNASIVKGGESYEIAQGRSRTRTCLDCYEDLYITEDNCIPYMLFYGTKLETIILPNNVTSIGGYAFSECSNLTSLNIPNSVISIGDHASSGCRVLTSVIIPNSMSSIGSAAFYYCSSLATVISEIEKPFEIEENVFGGISSDAQLIVPKGTKAAYQATEGWNKFANIVEAGEDMTEVDGVSYIVEGETAVASMGVDVKDEVKVEEFVEIDGKTYIVTAIAAGAFQGNVEITSVVIPNSVEAIGESAFEDCTGIISIVIGKAIKEIARRAFADFLIDAGTRADGNGIDVYCYAEEVPNTAEDAFDGTPTEKSTLHVPASAIEKYRVAWPWSYFKEIVALDEDAPDGIRGVKQDNRIGEYYDLTGRRVHNPQKGLYIRNNKKVVVK